ncbi:MAG: Rrf2 family protein [Hyphomicrobiaceae bacterium]|jgi:Rrf2 family protein
MHLSSQEEYGFRCLLQVARHEGPDPMPTAQIAEREGLTPEYTAKLMRLLRQGDLVHSTRGASGGYRLGREPETISVWNVLEVLGGGFFQDAFCEEHSGALRDCAHSTNCSLRAVWRGLDSLVRTALSAITLEDLRHGERPTEWITQARFAAQAPDFVDPPCSSQPNPATEEQR